MENEKMIDTLFEQARNEAPRISFKETTAHFVSTASGIGFATVLKTLIKNINLNQIIMILSAPLLLTTIWLTLTFSTTPDVSPQEPPQATLTVDSVIVKEKKPIKTTKPQLKTLIAKDKVEVIEPRVSVKTKKPTIKPIIPKAQLNDLLVVTELTEVITDEVIIGFVDTIPTEVLVEEALIASIPTTIVVVDTTPITTEGEFSICSCGTPENLDEFWQNIRSLGIDGSIDWKYKKRKGYIKKIKINMQSENGMEMRMRIEGFSQFTFYYTLNAEGNLQKLTYSIDKGKARNVCLMDSGTFTYKKTTNSVFSESTD